MTIKAVIIPFKHHEKLQKFLLGKGFKWCNGSTKVDTSISRYDPLVLYIGKRGASKLSYGSTSGSYVDTCYEAHEVYRL